MSYPAALRGLFFHKPFVTLVTMKRRDVLLLSTLAISAAYPLTRLWSKPMNEEDNANKQRLQLDPNPQRIEPFSLDEVEWKMRLDEETYYVMREEGTERPFTSPLNDEKRNGEFACAACGLVLFRSDHKFDSGTGWPSFWQPIEGRIETRKDYKLFVPRTEYHCARCGGHQGHVFKDGPKPTGLRYCNNGVALTFIPSEDE